MKSRKTPLKKKISINIAAKNYGFDPDLILYKFKFSTCVPKYIINIYNILLDEYLNTHHLSSEFKVNIENTKFIIDKMNCDTQFKLLSKKTILE